MVRIMPKEDDKEYKFQYEIGTNLDYEMLCEPTCLDHKINREIISVVIVLST